MLIFYLPSSVQTSSFGLAQIIVGRIVTGVGNGMNTSTIPVYQSEIAPPKIRGFLVLFEVSEDIVYIISAVISLQILLDECLLIQQGALITLGIVISYWLNYGFWFITQYGSFQWRYAAPSYANDKLMKLIHVRFPIAFQVVFAVILMIGILLFPESPRYVVLLRRTNLPAVDTLADGFSSTARPRRAPRSWLAWRTCPSIRNRSSQTSRRSKKSTPKNRASSPGENSSRTKREE